MTVWTMVRYLLAFCVGAVRAAVDTVLRRGR